MLCAARAATACIDPAHSPENVRELVNARTYQYYNYGKIKKNCKNRAQSGRNIPKYKRIVIFFFFFFFWGGGGGGGKPYTFPI